jgi:hypothetical protein
MFMTRTEKLVHKALTQNADPRGLVNMPAFYRAIDALDPHEPTIDILRHLERYKLIRLSPPANEGDTWHVTIESNTWCCAYCGAVNRVPTQA